MLTVLFWNVNAQRHCEPLCANLVRAHAVDILVVAECQRPPATLAAINAAAPPLPFRRARTANPCRVSAFTRFDRPEFTEVESGTRHCIHALSGVNRQELLLVSVHATSLGNESAEELEEELRALAARIEAVEAGRGHSRTLLVGDLNADPFDRRVTAATGLHAVRVRGIAEQGSRVVKGVRYPFFFNPMWRVYAQPHPPGTYFYRRAVHDLRFWHVFDQALLRPDLLPYFAPDDLRVLTDDGTTSFHAADGIPDRDAASDHFPVMLTLSYPGV